MSLPILACHVSPDIEGFLVTVAEYLASASFQAQDWMHLQFPAKMYVDYVRVYQRSDVSDGTTCDPPNYPTADYISRCVIRVFHKFGQGID